MKNKNKFRIFRDLQDVQGIGFVIFDEGVLEKEKEYFDLFCEKFAFHPHYKINTKNNKEPTAFCVSKKWPYTNEAEDGFYNCYVCNKELLKGEIFGTIPIFNNEKDPKAYTFKNICKNCCQDKLKK
jgi:hypothetical protein